MKYYFHVNTQAKRFNGIGDTCFDAACNALGTERAIKLSRNTTQTRYAKNNEIVSDNESGVSFVMSKNGFTVATIARLS
jgi:hypothetical protein